jgi:hypothetical protein
MVSLKEPHISYCKVAGMGFSLSLIYCAPSDANIIIDIYLLFNTACAALNENIAINLSHETG